MLYKSKSIQSSTTPDPGYQWESDKLTVRHHKREPRGQPFPNTHIRVFAVHMIKIRAVSYEKSVLQRL